MAETRPRAVLLFSCPDRRGIVAEVSHFIFSYGGNIVQADQHNDPETNTFFMRVDFDIGDFELPHGDISDAFKPIGTKFCMNYAVHYRNVDHRLALFCSKQTHCLHDLLLRHREGEVGGKIVTVISNHDAARDIAGYFDLPFYHTPLHKGSEGEGEERQLALLRELEIDLIVLARYMRILSPDFVRAYPDKIINIHHSFLPAFVGAKPYHQAFSRGVKIIGATSHYVTADLDQGPIIEQDVTRVSHRDSVDDLVSKGKNLEKLVLARAVKLHLEHRVLVFRNKTVVFE